MFIKSSYCAADSPQCVEVDKGTNGVNVVQVRDSKQGVDGPVLSFTHDEWTAFIAGVKSGEFDLKVAVSV